MAAPRGSYTPKSGPLAGRTFPLQPGDSPTAPYNRYQSARAQAMGFGGGYREQREITGVPYIQNLINRAVHAGGMSRSEATIQVRNWYASQPQPPGPYGAVVAASPYRGRSARAGAQHSERQGLRKRAAIKFALDQGWYDSAEEAEAEIDY